MVFLHVDASKERRDRTWGCQQLSAPIASLAPACSMPSPAPSAAERLQGKLAWVFICCLEKHLFFMQPKFTSVTC